MVSGGRVLNILDQRNEQCSWVPGRACFKCHKEANCLELKKHGADENREDQTQHAESEDADKSSG